MTTQTEFVATIREVHVGVDRGAQTVHVRVGRQSELVLSLIVGFRLVDQRVQRRALLPREPSHEDSHLAPFVVDLDRAATHPGGTSTSPIPIPITRCRTPSRRRDATSPLV